VYVTYNMLTEGRLKVKGSHVHGKTGNVSQTEYDKDVVTADH